MRTAYWQTHTEVYDGDGRERTVWCLIHATADTLTVLERTRHRFQVAAITAQYTQQGWTITPRDLHQRRP